MAKVIFGGQQSGFRIMVVDGVTMHVSEDQVRALLQGEPGSVNDPLSIMPDGQLCGTLVPEGSVKFTLSQDELEAAQRDYSARNRN